MPMFWVGAVDHPTLQDVFRGGSVMQLDIPMPRHGSALTTVSNKPRISSFISGPAKSVQSLIGITCTQNISPCTNIMCNFFNGYALVTD